MPFLCSKGLEITALFVAFRVARLGVRRDDTKLRVRRSVLRKWRAALRQRSEQ
jgi:hypothetical protein